MGVEQNSPMRTPGRREARVLARDREVAGGDELAARRGGDAVHLRDHGLREAVDRHHQLAAGVEQLARGRQRAAGHLREVVTGAERGPLAAHDDRVHRDIGGGLGERGEQVAQQGQRERVAAFGPVEHERAHARGVLDAEWGGGDGCHAPRIPPQTASSACGVGSKR